MPTIFQSKTANTDGVKVADRQVAGRQPDNSTPTGGTTPSGGGGGGGSPTGAAGGGLTGTYPNPGLSGTAILAGSAVCAVATTWANMKAATWLLGASPAVDGDLVQLLGWNYRDDGGGGMFEWNAASTVGDDGGTIMQLTGVATGRLFRTNVGTYNSAYLQNVTLDIRWFGGMAGNAGGVIGNSTALLNAVTSINNAVTYNNGTVYFPAGNWSFNTPVYMAASSNQAIVIKGDGLATVLENALTTPPNFAASTVYTAGQYVIDTNNSLPYRCILGYTSTATHPASDGTHWAAAIAFFDLNNGTGTSIQDLQFANASGYSMPSGVAFHGVTYGAISNVLINGLTASAATSGGGLLNLFGNTSILVSNVTAVGSGPALYYGGGSVNMTGCTFSTTTNQPAGWIASGNSLLVQDCFFSGGGPWLKFSSCAVTGAGGSITFACAGHTYVVGDWLVVTGAANASYNGIWKITSVVAATSVTVAVSYISNDTANIASEWSCLLIQAGNGLIVTESTFEHIFCNTGGSPALGSCGILVDAWHWAASGAKCQGFIMQNLFCDYGQTALHLYGKTNTDPSSSCANILVDNLRPNGGPKDTFGSLRIEGCTTVTVTNPQFFPGNSNNTTGEYDSIVVSDGGQAQNTQDISITGGSATNKNSSGLFASATIVAFTFDGANVHNTSIVNCAVDAAKTVSQVVNRSGTGSAAYSNGITVLYGNNAGRMTLIDSTGTHNL